MNNFFERGMNSIRKRIRFFTRLIISKKTRQVVIEQKGGLASQFGLYIFGEYLRSYYGKDVVYDISWFDIDGKDINGKFSRKWELENCFELIIPKADSNVATMLKKWLPSKSKNQFVFDKNPPLSPCYWRSEMSSVVYKIKMESLLHNIKFNQVVIESSKREKDEILRWKNSVAIHVRRGDFVNSIHDVCGVDYYRRAIEVLLETLRGLDGVKFFIFSNGFDWVKDNLLSIIPPGFPIELMQKNDNDHMHGDLFLMSMCRHQIIPNSGFGQIATLLRPLENRIVIEPNEIIRGISNIAYPGHICISVR